MKKLIAALAIALPQTACFGLFDTPDTRATQSAQAWQSLGIFSNLDVYGHKFHSAAIENAGGTDKCRMQATVFYDAPANETFRFRAKLTLADGSWVKSPEFTNSGAGHKYHAFSVDTSASGCWGANRQDILALNVSGCAGAYCTPNPLD